MTLSPRVYELAKELGVESRLVLAMLADVGMPVRSASSSLSALQEEAVRSQMERNAHEGTHATQPDHPSVVTAPEPPPGALASEVNLRRLIHQAFQQAKQSGRSDWRTMNIAVLKNRLLNLTDRAFKESDYGARTVRDLVRRLSDLLTLDESVRPAAVTLLQGEPPQVLPVVGPGSRVRPDLWRSIIDYQSGKRYVWNGAIALAADYLEDRSVRQVFPSLPTLTEEEMDGWRSRFIEKSEPLLEGDNVGKQNAEVWLTGRRGTQYLPGKLRGPWNQELKTRVIERLETWFNEVGESIPPDLLKPVRSPQSSIAVSVSADRLRKLVLKCVHAMTEDELRDLALPASAVLRSQG